MKDLLDSNFMKIAKGIGIACAITLILLFIYAFILTYTGVSENTMAPVIILVTGVSILARKFYTVQEL